MDRPSKQSLIDELTFLERELQACQDRIRDDQALIENIGKDMLLVKAKIDAFIASS